MEFAAAIIQRYNNDMPRKFILILLGIVILGTMIRIYRINNTSLFGDELDFGYQALSLVQTGNDYFGHTFPIYFQSLSEWKTSAFIYTISPFVAVFGITDLGIRLPSIIFGILSLVFIFLLTKELTGNNYIALISAFFLAITPWHIHYSRIGFEASEMFFTYIAGVYFFYKARKNHKLLLVSSFFFAISFIVYRTQLIFVPFTLLLLIWIFRKELWLVPKKTLFFSAAILLVISLPYAYQTFFGPGSQRYSSLSIFNTEIMNNAVGISKLEDERYQKPNALTQLSSKLFHNKYIYYSNIAVDNFLKSYSTDFLFISGDPNPRENVPGTGELFKYQLIFLLVGLTFFVDKNILNKNKTVVLSWLIISPLASSLTRDGAYHATRLFMMLLPLSLIFSYGVYFIYMKFKTKLGRKIYLSLLGVVSLIFLVNFLHIYFVHYPSVSEVWWQSGFKEAITAAVSEKNNFDGIIISSADEPAEIYFLAYSTYPPKKFQNNLFQKRVNLKGFGEVSEIENYLFPDIGVGKDLYTLAKDLQPGYLYLATAKEISLNLITEPERIPSNLKLIKAVTYPSGRPAYYLFSQK